MWGIVDDNAKEEKLTEAALLQCFGIIYGVWKMGFDAGYETRKRETTTGSSPAVSPVTNIGPGAKQKARKPSGRK